MEYAPPAGHLLQGPPPRAVIPATTHVDLPAHHEPTIACVQQTSPATGITIKGMGGRTTLPPRVFLDSGAHLSLLGANLVHRLGLPTVPGDIQLAMADDRPSPYMRVAVPVTVVIAAGTEQELVVTHDNFYTREDVDWYDILLGQDMHWAAGLLPDPKAQLLYYDCALPTKATIPLTLLLRKRALSPAVFAYQGPRTLTAAHPAATGNQLPPAPTVQPPACATPLYPRCAGLRLACTGPGAQHAARITAARPATYAAVAALPARPTAAQPSSYPVATRRHLAGTTAGEGRAARYAAAPAVAPAKGSHRSPPYSRALPLRPGDGVHRRQAGAPIARRPPPPPKPAAGHTVPARQLHPCP